MPGQSLRLKSDFMGLEEVVAEINNKANSDAAAILKEGRAMAAQVLGNAEKEIKEKKAAAAADLEIVKSASERKEIADAELKCKKQMQDVKKELIAASYDGAKAKISAMGERERAKILEQLFERSARQLDGIGAVYVSHADMKLAASIFKPKKVSVHERNILGGLVAESKDGKILVDYSFDSIVDSMKESMIKDVSRILF